MTRNMPEPCKFPSLDSCQTRFLWTDKEVDLALHPVVGLVLQIGDAEKFSRARWCQKPGFFFFQTQQASPCFTAIEEDGYDKRLEEL